MSPADLFWHDFVPQLTCIWAYPNQTDPLNASQNNIQYVTWMLLLQIGIWHFCIYLVVIRFVWKHLRWHVIWGIDHRAGHVWSTVKNSSNTQVPHLWRKQSKVKTKFKQHSSNKSAHVMIDKVSGFMIKLDITNPLNYSFIPDNHKCGWVINTDDCLINIEEYW